MVPGSIKLKLVMDFVPSNNLEAFFWWVESTRAGMITGILIGTIEFLLLAIIGTYLNERSDN